MSSLKSKAKTVAAEWVSLCGGCLKPDITDVPMSLLAGYIARALEEERKTCIGLVKAALKSGDDRDFEWGNKLLKSMRSRAQ